MTQFRIEIWQHRFFQSFFFLIPVERRIFGDNEYFVPIRDET